MATLVSPGVSVMVTDESQYVAATQGTLPLVVVATASNKTDGSGTALAAGTIPANSGVAYLVSSQRELVETFGEPNFYEVGGSIVQGSETSEYGLLAAYQYLGVSNNAYIIRADIDLAELEASTEEPAGVLANGTYWHEATASDYGLFEYNGTAWVAKAPAVLMDAPGTGNVEPMNSSGYAAPVNTFGSAGDFAVVTSTTKMSYWKKISTTWVLLGDIGSPNFSFANYAPASPITTDVYVRLTKQGGGIDIKLANYNSVSGAFQALQVPVYSNDDIAINNSLMTLGDVYARRGETKGVLELRRHTGATETKIQSEIGIVDTSSITTAFTVSVDGNVTAFSFTTASIDTVITSMQNNSELNDNNVKIEKVGTNKIRLIKTDGKGLTLSFSAGANDMGFTSGSTFIATVWEDLSYESSTLAPKGDIAPDTLWYNADLKMELMRVEFVNGEQQWVKYAWSEDNDGIYGNELQLRSSRPTARKDGSSVLVAGDIWVDTDAVNYPVIWRYSGAEWVKLDNADQSSTNGMIFGHYSADAPYDTLGNENARTAHEKTPNAELLPENILMVNMDYTTYNVKQYVDGKWEWASGVNLDGSGKFGSLAQRHMVSEAMSAALVANEGIRAEAVYFNLIAAPGYPELTDEMIGLNKDKKEIAFVIGDTPMTLKGTATDIKAWADNNTVTDAYAGVYYPHGLTTDLSGNEVVMPASAIALRTIAFSDQVSFPWFAPAGLTRGIVTNASQVGYVNSENEFVRVRLTEGQRDVMYANRMNPIADMPGTGLVVYGQKTRQSFASALDRINVARLVNHMRYSLDQLSRGFLFEQNDKITRDNMRDAVERFCGGLVTNRGLYDFLVVCDESNNTPARIDRNELWVDIAIQPVKSVEFIYIPLRIRNTGEEL
jgi:hypothetical protein